MGDRIEAYSILDRSYFVGGEWRYPVTADFPILNSSDGNPFGSPAITTEQFLIVMWRARTWNAHTTIANGFLPAPPADYPTGDPDGCTRERDIALYRGSPGWIFDDASGSGNGFLQLYIVRISGALFLDGILTVNGMNAYPLSMSGNVIEWIDEETGTPGSMTTTITSFWEYANSNGDRIWDAATGAKLRDPLS